MVEIEGLFFFLKKNKPGGYKWGFVVLMEHLTVPEEMVLPMEKVNVQCYSILKVGGKFWYMNAISCSFIIGMCEMPFYMSTEFSNHIIIEEFQF